MLKPFDQQVVKHWLETHQELNPEDGSLSNCKVYARINCMGKVHQGCVMSLENMMQGCIKVQLWCDKATEIGASMSIVNMPIVCENGPPKIIILVRQRHLMVRQFYDAAGTSWPWMSDAHNRHWHTFPGVVGCVLQLISALWSSFTFSTAWRLLWIKLLLNNVLLHDNMEVKESFPLPPWWHIQNIDNEIADINSIKIKSIKCVAKLQILD